MKASPAENASRTLLKQGRRFWNVSGTVADDGRTEDASCAFQKSERGVKEALGEPK